MRRRSFSELLHGFAAKQGSQEADNVHDLPGLCHQLGDLGLLGGTASAAPGDIHRVSEADVVNLGVGPTRSRPGGAPIFLKGTDASNIRGRVDQGDEVIELTRDGNYGGLLEGVAQSGLLPGTAEQGPAMPVSCSCPRISAGPSGG